MIFPVVFTPAARADIFEAIDWYETRRDGLEKDFAMELDGLIARIGANSLQFPIIHRNLRRAVLHRFPYCLLYRVLPDLIQVIACSHTRRDPVRWKRRT